MKRLLPLFFLVACAKGPVNAKRDPRDYYPQDIVLVDCHVTQPPNTQTFLKLTKDEQLISLFDLNGQLYYDLGECNNRMKLIRLKKDALTP